MMMEATVIQVKQQVLEQSFVPFALTMIINQDFISESQILSFDSDFSSETEEQLLNSVELQGIKLLSSFEVTDLFQVGYIHAMYPWYRPKGYCLAMYLPVIPILGNDDVIIDPVPLMIAVVINRSLTPILTAHQDAIYAEMEELMPQISECTAKMLLLHQHAEVDELMQHVTELKSTLRRLRQNVKNSLSKWVTDLVT